MRTPVSVPDRDLRRPVRQSTHLVYIVVCITCCLAVLGVFCHSAGAAVSDSNTVSPDWQFTVTDPTYPIRPGLTIIYTITYQNTGDAQATGTVLTDTLDPRVDYLLSTRAGIYDPDDHTVTWSPGTVDTGGSGIIILRVKTRDGIPHNTGLINRAGIRCAEGARSNYILITPVTYLTILKIYKTSTTRIAYRGQLIDFDISVLNLGDTTATEVILTDFLPEQATVVSCSDGCQPDSGGERISWRWDTVPVDSLFSVILSMRLDSTYNNGALVINRASITCNEASSDSDVCAIPVDTTVSPTSPGAPAFALSVRGRDTYIRPGDEMQYRIECRNEGLAVANSVEITDALPVQVTYLGSGSGGHYDPVTHRINWSIARLERRQRKTLDLSLRINEDLENRSRIINTVFLACAEGFTATATETTTVLAAPAVNITSGSTSTEAVRGRPVTFTTCLRNTGTAPARDVTVTDLIPEHTILAGYTGGGILDARQEQITWHVESIPASGRVELSVTVTIPADFPSAEAVINRTYWQADLASDSISVSVPLLLPRQYALEQNYPNPFNAETAISYQLSAFSEQSTHNSPLVTLKIYNLLGQEVRTLVNGVQESGYYTVSWDGKDAGGRDVSSGIYYCSITAGNGAWWETKKMILLR